MANSGGARKAQDKAKYFCISCGGVTVLLTPEEAALEISHGHDIISPIAPGRSTPLAGSSVAPGANLGGREGSGR